ncbi:MAG: hypothetical protein PUD15_06550 [Prevotella sp.]|nr:hypothetical protein [Prevotella sp.]
MKKISTYMVMLAVAAMPLAFTSCDDDYWNWWDDYDDPYYDNGYSWNYNYNNPYDGQEDEALALAQTLNGQWVGTMEYLTASENTVSNFGIKWTFAQYDTNSLSGNGTEIDTDNQGNTQTLEFSWYVDEQTEDIYMKYADGKVFVMDINPKNNIGFYLDGNKGTFDGYAYGTNTNDAFYFKTIRNNSSYAKSYGSRAASTSTATTFGHSVKAPTWTVNSTVLRK